MKAVTAAIIIDNGKVLIARRGPGENLAGKWEFPGGKVEQGESPEECLAREIREEFDAEIEVLDFFGESVYDYKSGAIRLAAYYCRWKSGEFKLKVHSRIEWAGGKELAAYDFAPADVPFVKKLRNEL